jgi:hypothetical protein
MRRTRNWLPGVLATGIGALACSERADSPVAGPSAPAMLDRIQIEPSATIDAVAGTTLQLEARATYTDGSTAIVTKEARWESLATAVATVDANGRVALLAGGEARIRATYVDRAAERTLTVRPRAGTLVARIQSIAALEDCDGATSGRGDFTFLVALADRRSWHVFSHRYHLQLASGEAHQTGLIWNLDVVEEAGEFADVVFEATENDAEGPDPRLSNRRGAARFSWTTAGGWSPEPGRARQITLGQSGCSVRLHYQVDVR